MVGYSLDNVKSFLQSELEHVPEEYGITILSLDTNEMILEKNFSDEVYGEYIYDIDNLNAKWEFKIYQLENKRWNQNHSYYITLMVGFLVSIGVATLLMYALKNISKKNIQIEGLKKKMRVDPLTKLGNRVEFDIWFVNNKTLNQHPFSILLIDIDKFKDINDVYGHSVGDSVLQSLAATMKSTFRSDDLVIRWGGEEFVVILDNTAVKQALIAAEHLRLRISELNFEGVHEYVTVSIGVAAYSKEESIQDLFDKADYALYKAKESGRNKVICYNDELEKEQYMESLKWNDNWLCGNERIDDEHRQLMDMSNDILATMYKMSEKEFDDKLKKLIHEIKVHFDNEEEELKRIGYNQTDHHEHIHHSIIDEVDALYNDLVNNKVSKSHLYDFLVNEVVINHMTIEDAKYFHIFKDDN